MDRRDAENTNKPLALILTLGTHGALILILFFFYITTPIPPYPEGGGGGMGVNFGTSEDGAGEIQPEKYYDVELDKPVHNSEQVQEVVKTVENNNLVTQNIEETAELKTDDIKKDDKKEDIKENKVKEEVKVEKKEERKPINTKILFPGKKNTDSKSEGETQGDGDQGKKEGNPKSKYHWGKGNGEGNGDGDGNGVGNGTGNGNGDGDGDGDGNGKDKKGKGKNVSYNLKGRKAKALPPPEYNDNDQGKVVVDVIVDRDGNVTKATVGKGTTTSSSVLIEAAKRAAKNAKFTKNPDAAEFQKGSITYHFRLQ